MEKVKLEENFHDLPGHKEFIKPVFVNSIDDIPVIQDGIAPISFVGLNRRNLVKQFIDYIGTLSDAYPEYAFQTGIAILSTLVRRRVYFERHRKKEFCNLWTLSLGWSGYAHKSVSISVGEDMLLRALEEPFLPQDITPAGLIELISDVEIHKTKKGDLVKYNIEHKIRRAECALWKDEIGQFYASLKKGTYMSSLKEYMNLLYDCKFSRINPSVKTIKSTTYKMYENYFVMNGATTASSFLQSNNLGGQSDSGFLYRHLEVYPTYLKKEYEGSAKADKGFENYFVLTLKLIDSLLLGDNELEIDDLTSEQEKIYKNWAKSREERFAKEGDENMVGFFSRMQISALKIAILIEIGNLPYYITKYISEHGMSKNSIIINTKDSLDGDDGSKNSFKYINGEMRIHTELDISYSEEEKIFKDIISGRFKLTRISISNAALMYAMYLVDEVYIPYTIKILGLLDSKETKGIFRTLKEKKRVERSKLLRIGITAAELDKQIESLKEAGAVKEYLIRGTTKPIIVYSYIPEKQKSYAFKKKYDKLRKGMEKGMEKGKSEGRNQRSGIRIELTKIVTDDLITFIREKVEEKGVVKLKTSHLKVGINTNKLLTDFNIFSIIKNAMENYSIDVMPDENYEYVLMKRKVGHCRDESCNCL